MKNMLNYVIIVCGVFCLMTSCVKEEAKVKKDNVDENESVETEGQKDQNPAKIIIISGNNQEADWEDTLNDPLVVKVVNKSGYALKNVRVGWRVQSDYDGAIIGKLGNTEYHTDSNGIAKTKYTVGKQQEKAETVLVEAIGSDWQPVPNTQTTFTYKQKRRNFTLVQLKHETDSYESGTTSVLMEWKNGDKITVMENEILSFNIKEDGKLVRLQNGNVAHFLLSPKGIINKSKYSENTFQFDDIILKNWSVLFPDPISGRTDSIVVDLTISNLLYRTFFGKTIKVHGGGAVEDGNVGELVTFKYRTDGKAEAKSLLFPRTPDIVTTYTSHNTYRYVPVYGCSDKSTGITPYVMKQTIGIITSPDGPSMAYGMNSAFLLFADGSIKPQNHGTGFDACTYSKYWGSINLE